MTLAVQKNTKALSNDDIFNSIIKKENGVNPFLTIMNFKISFKTWLKLARKTIRIKEKGQGNNMASVYDTDEAPVMIAVDIEVEKFYSTTSEEEVDVLSYSMSKKKTMAQGKMSPTGSQGDLNAS